MHNNGKIRKVLFGTNNTKIICMLFKKDEYGAKNTIKIIQ